MSKSPIKFAQIFPKRNRSQIHAALQQSSWYPRSYSLNLYPPAVFFPRKFNEWERETIRKKIESSLELYIQAGDDQTDFVSVFNLISLDWIQREFLLSKVDRVHLEMSGTRVEIPFDNLCGREWFLDMTNFKANLLKQKHVEVYFSVHAN